MLVRNSTITDITDGLYTAAQAIPANTVIDKTYLTAVSGGGLNALNSKLNDYVRIVSFTGANTGSIAAGATKSFTDVNVSNAIPSGYKMIGVYPGHTGDDGFVVYSCAVVTATTINYAIRNCASTADSGTPEIRLIVIKS